MAQALNLSQDWGVILSDVLPDGAADRAGLRVGDLVLTLNGKPIENARQFDVNVYSSPISEMASIGILRGTKSSIVDVRVEERPGRTSPFLSMVTPERNLVESLGILGIDYKPRLKNLLPKLRRNYGVIIAARAADAPFRQRQSGLFPGDVIYSLNRETVRNLSDLRQELDKPRPYDPISLQLERDGQLMYVTFEKE